jgi:hypothetical protein
MPTFLFRLKTFVVSLCVSSAFADLAPLKVGNEWVYSGRFSGNWSYAPNSVDWGVPSPIFHEKLNMVVTSRRTFGDSVFVGVSLRDSLFQRQRSWDKQPLPDTVVTQQRTYAETKNAAMPTLVKVVGDSFPSFMPVFFAAHNTVDIKGKWTRVDSTGIYSTFQLVSDSVNNYRTEYKNWVVNTIGLYWSLENRRNDGSCGNARHVLKLESFNGAIIDLKRLPPEIAPLPKVAKSACSDVKPGNRTDFKASVSKKSKRLDALGRTIPKRFRGPVSTPILLPWGR